MLSKKSNCSATNFPTKEEGLSRPSAAWLCMHGHFPDGLLDHKTRNPSSCRIADLRKATHNAARAGEGLITDKELREKYELSPADWRNITESTALGRAARAERERRMLDGTAARESAARHLVKGPGILDEIMTGAQSHPKHKIEAFKELRATAASGSGDRPRESERFVIRIDLTAGGGEVESYDRTIDIKVNSEPSEGKPDGNEW